MGWGVFYILVQGQRVYSNGVYIPPHQVNIQSSSRLQGVQSVCRSIQRVHRLLRVADYVECLQGVQGLCRCVARSVCRCGVQVWLWWVAVQGVELWVWVLGVSRVKPKPEYIESRKQRVCRDKLQEVLTEYLQSMFSEALDCPQRLVGCVQAVCVGCRLQRVSGVESLSLSKN